MDKDRVVGSAKEFGGRVEGAVGDIAGDSKTQASGRAREAAGTVQDLYGQAKDAARDATDAAVAGQSTRRADDCGRCRVCAGFVDRAARAPSPAALALL
jgi:uncharacterized protein YjbJ (UPF0337 family)